MPVGLFEIRLTLDGFAPFTGVSHWGRPLQFTLIESAKAPPDMVWVPAGALRAGREPVMLNGYWITP